MKAITSTIAAFLTERGVVDPVVTLDKPADFKFGDIASNVALRYAKELKTAPLQIAEGVVEALKVADIEDVADASAIAPGFINISLAPSFFAALLRDILDPQSTFATNTSESGQKWVIEHTSPNPNKAMHLGHLRNNLVGMGLVHLLEASGAEVVSEAVDNNRGIAIAKLMWGYLNHQKKEERLETSVEAWLEHKEGWYTPAEKDTLPDRFVSLCYIQGEEDLKADPELESQIRDLVVRWEAGDQSVWALWEYVLGFAYEGMNRTLARLGNRWDKVWHEHEHYQKGKDYVEEGLAKGIFQTLEDGAVLTNLEEGYNIPDTVLLKRDGTSLYITQDLALTALKKEHHKADRLVWVVGPEQSLAFKQLFAVCEQLGIGALDEFAHVSYGYVGLKDEDGSFKKMSSRAGTVVLIDDVIDRIKGKIIDRLTENEKTPADLDAHAETLALAAVKFALLKSDRNQDLVFDEEQSIEMTGDSGVYLLYTYVRTQSILAKHEGELDVATLGPTALGEEADLVRKLMYFPAALERAREDLSVHHIAQAVLEIALAYNSWYAKEQVLDGSEREQYKLAVTSAAGTVLKEGLAILGIDTVDHI